MIKKAWEKIKFEIKMHYMDYKWRLFGGGCFGEYPPSFYHRHTPEEIKKITEDDKKNLLDMIEEMKE